MKIEVKNLIAVMKDGVPVIVTKIKIENNQVVSWKDSFRWFSMRGVTLKEGK